MSDRKNIETTEELGKWYDQKYTEMGDGWHTPPEECDQHLNDLGVPYDKDRWLLDIGCGAGHFLQEASKRVSCLGLDISQVGLGLTVGRTKDAPCRVFLERNSIENELGTNVIPNYDYIVSIGSLEHVIDIDRALDRIYRLLKRRGRWYFYCPNERWEHFDQPNERTHTDEEWKALFEKHGLIVVWSKRWGGNEDNTAFCGVRDDHPAAVIEIPKGDKLNVGSGQRPFQSEAGWINIDRQGRWQPDLIGDWNDLSMFKSDSMKLVVSHHSLEHVGCGEGDPFIREAYRVLQPGGSLLIFVPDIRALAQRWLTRQLTTQVFMTNLYGAYMGSEEDRHKWGYDPESLWMYLKNFKLFKDVHVFNWRTIPGADIAKDWWILGMEAVK